MNGKKKIVFGVLLLVILLFAGGFVVFGDKLTQLLVESPLARILLPQREGSDGSGLLAEFEQSLLSSQREDTEEEAYDKSRRKATEKEIAELTSWASTQTITLTGITKSIRVLYEKGLDSEDETDIGGVPGIWQIGETLKKIPETLIEVMANKTIYVSSVTEPSFTVLRGNAGGKLRGVHEGIILAQPIIERSILREFAHFLNFQGIEGLSVPRNVQLYGLRDKYKSIFTPTVPYTKEVPEGYISSLSTSNTFENFAEHFTAYILDADMFRMRASKEPKLAEKYIFLRDQLFERTEY